jgi:hypothetical protein
MPTDQSTFRKSESTDYSKIVVYHEIFCLIFYFPRRTFAMRSFSAATSDAPISANPYHEMTARPRRPATMLNVRATIPRGVKLINVR